MDSIELIAGRRYWFPLVVLSGQDETAEWDDNVNKVKSGILTGKYNERGLAQVMVNSDIEYWVEPLYLFQKDKRSAHKRW